MSRRTQKNVGVIGLGIIGRRVADNLRRRGFHVFVWNRTPRPYPNFVGSPAELAELCDFVQVFVSDDEALMQMVQQMKRSLGPEHVIMAHSTVAPHTMRNAAEIVQRRGAHFLDAPFTGSKVAAEKGELVYYVAGDDAAYRRARRVLEASSKEIIEIGEIGQATTVKIATNMITAASVQAAAEALALVHNSGLAPEKFVAAMRGNASNSGTLAMKLPKMIEGDFDPHFSVKHMLKDVQIAARMARSYGLTLGATEAARDSLIEEARAGRADADYSSLINFFFPDGLPGQAAAAAEGDDAQAKLDSVDEEAAAQARRDEASREAETQPGEAKAAEPADAADRDVVEDAVRDDVVEAVESGSEETTRKDGEAEPLAAHNEATADENGTVTGAAEATPRADDDAAPRAGETETDAAPPTSEGAPVVADEGAQPTDAAENRADALTSGNEREPELGREAATASADDKDAAGDEPGPSAAADDTDIDGDAGELQAGEPEIGRDREPRDIDTRSSERDVAGAAEAPRVEEPPPSAGRDEAREPEISASAVEETPAVTVADDDLAGEPPMERRVSGDRSPAAAEPAREREEVAARRGFLSRMFGKGPDY